MIYDNHLDTPQTLQARTKGTYEKPPERSRNPYNTKGRREGTKDKPLGPSQLTGTRSRGAYDKPLGQSIALTIRPQKQMSYDNHLDAKKGDTRQTCRPLLHHRNKRRAYDKPLGQSLAPHNTSPESNYICQSSRRSPNPTSKKKRDIRQICRALTKPLQHERTKRGNVRQTSKPLPNHRTKETGGTNDKPL